MKRLDLQWIDPRFMNALPTEGRVINGNVVVGSTTLTFPDGVPYPDETPVMVYCKRDFCCESLAEIEQARHALAQRIAAREAQERAEQAQRDDAARAFNAALNIPVKWMPEHRHITGGIACNGTQKKTVQHIFLLDELHSGRVHRRANSYLCSAKDNDVCNGWAIDTTQKGVEFNMTFKVTCSRCLTIAARLHK